MRHLLRLSIGAVVCVGGLALLAGPAAAQNADEFYKGKKIEVVIGFTPGGSYDLYARTLSEFMPRYIPGNPPMLVQNKPGASSLNAAQHVFKIAPPDGLTIGLTGNLLPLEQLLEGANAKVDMSKVHWLGNMVENTSALTVWHTGGVKKLEDLKTKEIIVGSTGRSGETYFVPLVINALLGTKMKMVTGYPGMTEVMIAMERGEVQARSGSWQNVTQRPHWITENKIVPLLQIGVRKHRDLPDVPMFSDMVSSEGDKRIVDLISNSLAISRVPWLAPNVSDDKVKILRTAFAATLKDPEFLETAKKRTLDIDYMSGEEVERRLRKALDVPADLVQRMRKITSGQ